MIPAEVIHRTFRIAHGEKTGSAFAIDIDGKQYLVTARHVVETLGTCGAIEVFGNGAWQHVAVDLVAHGIGDIDVSVLAPRIALCPSKLPIKAASDGLVYGQDVYFLGFPYGVMSTVVFSGKGYPLPLVKKGIVSAFAGNVYLLDGHNNPGFSGGPVVFSPGGRGQPTNIAAVITGLNTSVEPVLADGEETSLTFEENTGIIISYKIEVALDMIRGNPIGIATP